MSVDDLPADGVDLGQLALVTEKDARIIHQLRHAGDAIVGHHEREIVGGETGASRFQMRRRDARGQHDKKIDRQILARFEHVADAIHAPDVGVLVRIDDHGTGAMRHNRARKFRDRDHRAFDVEMSVDQARREIGPGNVDDLLRVVIAEADHAAVIDGDIGFVNLAAQDVDQPRVFEKQLRRFFAARDTELMLNVSHDKTRSAIGWSGVASAGSEDVRPWIALKIASPVAGEASGTSPPVFPNIATASRIASRTEIASINGGSPTALLPWMTLDCTASERNATLKMSGVSPTAGIL